MPNHPPYDGYDLVLKDTIGLTLYKDGRSPAAQGGKFGQAEAMRGTSGQDQPKIFDRLTAGMGATDRLIPHSYALAIDGCTRFGRVWTPGGEITRLGVLPNGSGGRTPGRIRAICEFGNDLLIGAGGVLCRLTYPYTTFTVETTLDPTEEVASILIYQGFICLGTQKVSDGTPGRLYVKEAGGWTRSTNANRQYLAQAYFTVANVGAWRLVGNDTPTTFRFVSTPTTTTMLDNTAWASDSGAGYAVGDSTNPITAIAGGPAVLFHAKTDGVYHVQEDGRGARVVDWSSSIHPDNGKGMVFAYGSLYAQHGRQGLVKVDVANQQIQWLDQACSPGAYMPRITPIHGRNGALTLDGEWLVDAVYNGTHSFICYGRPNEVSQQIAMEQLRSPQALNWHGSEATFWNQEVTCLDQSSIGIGNRPLLWVGSMEGPTPVLSNVSLPSLGSPIEDLINGGAHRFTTASWLYLPREDYGDDNDLGWASVRKVFTRVEVNAELLERYVTWLDAYMSTASGHEIFWDRALDPDTTAWTLLGRMDDTERATLVPPTAVQSGVRASLMFRGFSERDKPFVFNTTKLRGLPILEQAERRRYRCTLAGRVRKRNRTQDHRDIQSLLNEVWALQWDDPVNLRDKYNTNLVVKVEEGLGWQEVTDPQTREPTVMVDFTVRVLKRPFYWGAGYRFGSDVVWS